MGRHLRLLVTYSTAGLLAAVVLLPLYWMLATSLKPTSEILSYPPDLLPSAYTGEHFRDLIETTRFFRYLVNSFIVAICVVLIVGIAAFLGGYSLSRFRFAGARVIAYGSLLGYMIAPIMIAIPFYLMMKILGIANTRLALILAHTSFCFPFALWLMKAYIDDIPVEVEKAARVDGANRLATMFHIVLPLSMPGLVAVSIFTFILSWNDYVFARILITGDHLKTIPVGLEDIYNATVTNWGMLMAAGVVITVPILLGFIFVHRALMKGWGYTGLKG